MATQTFVDRPFPDLIVPDLLDTRGHSDVVAPVAVVEPWDQIESDDGPNPARGVLVALLLCAPFWMGVFWMLS